MYKAKVDFLWYKRKETIKDSEFPENVAHWLKEGFIYDDVPKVEEPKVVVKDPIVEPVAELVVEKKGRWAKKK